MLYGGDWPVLQSKVRALVPEAFSSEGHLAGVWGGEWQTVGTPRPTFSPNDGSTLASTLNLDAQQARRAVQASALEAVVSP